MLVLVTGFGPFPRHRRNPTERLARRIDGRRIGRATVAGRVLPTEFGACARVLTCAMRETRPDAVIMLGLAARRRKLALEAIALNVDHSETPDNAGRRPWRRPIARGGPPLLESTLPIDRLYGALRRARLPVEVSHHAGTYVCNHAFYVGALLLRRLDRLGSCKDLLLRRAKAHRATWKDFLLRRPLGCQDRWEGFEGQVGGQGGGQARLSNGTPLGFVHMPGRMRPARMMRALEVIIAALPRARG